MVKKAIALCVVVLSLVTACSSAAPTPIPEATATPQEVLTTLNLNLGGEPATLDPAMVEFLDTASEDVIVNLFLGLVGVRDDTGEVIPQLATDWEASPDGLVWTFHLRDDVYWVHYDPQTGVAEKKRKVTAHDVEYAVRRTMNPSTVSGYAYLNFIIKDGEVVKMGARGASMASLGVQALDDHTIQFIMEQPAAYFPSFAGLWGNYPLPKEMIDEFGSRWTEPGNLWTCGPYLLDTWRHRNRIVLVKNPHYYDAGNVAIDRVDFAMVGEGLTALHMYENGDLDSIELPLVEPLEALQQARADPQLSQELHAEPALLTVFFAFNLTRPPVDNPLVRKALAAAVDKHKLVHEVLRADHIPAKTFGPPEVVGSPAGDPSFKGIPFDPKQAREWLAEAGYPDGEGFPELVVMYITFPELSVLYITAEGAGLVVDSVQEQWREHLGIQVKVVSQEMDAYLQTLREDPPHVFVHGCIADYRDEHNFVLEFWHPTQSANYSRWDPEDAAAARFMEVTEAAAAELDPQKREALYFEAEKILCVDEVIVVPLYHWAPHYLTKPYVERMYNPLAQGLARWRVQAH